jgi:outer membrane protein assembly factor BamE (lipoprotein component of BamABCDE complex)
MRKPINAMALSDYSFCGSVYTAGPRTEKMMRVTSTKHSHRLLLSLAAAATAMSLGGCAKIKTQQGYLVDKLLIDSIQPGIDNRASVEGALGRPTFTSQFNGGEYYYIGRDMRQLAFANPKPVAQTAVRIRFDAAGNVVAVDKAGLEKVANVSPEGGKTPTLGRQRGLLEDIFGNIGTVGAGGAGAGGAGGGGPNGS